MQVKETAVVEQDWKAERCTKVKNNIVASNGSVYQKPKNMKSRTSTLAPKCSMKFPPTEDLVLILRTKRAVVQT